MVAGKWLVIDGQIPGLNLSELKNQHHKAAINIQTM